MDRRIHRDRSESPARVSTTSSGFFSSKRSVTPFRTLTSPQLSREEAYALTEPGRAHSGYTYANSLIYRSSLADTDTYEIPNLGCGAVETRNVVNVSMWQRFSAQFQLFLMMIATYFRSVADHSGSVLTFLTRVVCSVLCMPFYIVIVGIFMPLYGLTRFVGYLLHYTGSRALTALGMATAPPQFTFASTARHNYTFVEVLRHSFLQTFGPSAPYSVFESLVDTLDYALDRITFFPPPFERFVFRTYMQQEHNIEHTSPVRVHSKPVTSPVLTEARLRRHALKTPDPYARGRSEGVTRSSSYERVEENGVTPMGYRRTVTERSVTVRDFGGNDEADSSANFLSGETSSNRVRTNIYGGPMTRGVNRLVFRTPLVDTDGEDTPVASYNLRNRAAPRSAAESHAIVERSRLPRTHESHSVDTDDEGFASGSDVRSRSSSMSNAVDSGRSIIPAAYGRWKRVCGSFASALVTILYVFIGLIAWFVERVVGGMRRIFVVCRDAVYSATSIVGRLLTGRKENEMQRASYSLRSRRVLRDVATHDIASEILVARRRSYAISKACCMWWLLPLIFLLVVFLAARDPNVMERVHEMRDSLPEGAQWAADRAGGFASTVSDTAYNAFTFVINGTRSFARTFMAILSDLAKAPVQLLIGAVSSVAEHFAAGYHNTTKFFSALLSDAWTLFLAGLLAVAEGTEAIISSIWVWLCKVPGIGGPLVTETIGALAGAIGGALGTVKEYVVIIGSSLISIAFSVCSAFAALFTRAPEPTPAYTVDVPQKPPVISPIAQPVPLSEFDIDSKINNAVQSLFQQQVSQLIDQKVNALLVDIRAEYLSKEQNAATRNDAEIASINAQLKALQDIKVMFLEKGREGPSGNIDLSNLEEKINEAIRKYNTDRTGMADYALESAGGSVVSTRCSETYSHATRLEKLFNIPLWYSYYGPRTVIQRSSPALVPGECWAFTGSVGFLTIRLARPIRVTSISYEHISKALTPENQINSAPKEITFFAYRDVSDIRTRVKLGDFVYSDVSEPLQFFPIQVDPGFDVEFVELQVDSNYGSPFTCLYRLRVHGQPVVPTASPSEADDV